MIALSLLGNFHFEEKEAYESLQTQLGHIEKNVTDDLNTLSVKALSVAQMVEMSLNHYATDNNISLQELDGNTTAIEGLLESQMNSLVALLDLNECSGCFLMLDATMLPDAPNSEFMKSGIFLKITQPNSVLPNKIHFLRGPSSIARKYSLGLLGQWQTEFNTQDEYFFEYVTSLTNENPNIPMNHAYYWTERTLLKNNSESGILLCIPLRDESNQVFGIFGIEVSSMQFKLAYSPNNDKYAGIFVSLTPSSSQDPLDFDKGLIAGNSYLTSSVNGQVIQTEAYNRELQKFTTAEQEYVGLTENLKFYSKDSIFGEHWSLSIMIPKTELDASIRQTNYIIFFSLFILFFIGLVIAFIFSKRYNKPLINAIEELKCNKITQNTKYLEINDLITFLSNKDKEYEARISNLESQLSIPDANMSSYNEFIQNIENLSPAERSVFNLYMEGYTANEITELLHLSINTIKTHNKRIFMKLNVSSRKELMVYVSMMKKGEKHD